MMDNIDNDNLDDLLERIQFRSLPYDVEDNYKRLQGNLRRKEITPAGDRRFLIWRFVGIAASLALLLVTTYHLITSNSPEKVVWYEITAVPDAKTKVVLPDSSAVWLNANACLRYPRSFEEDIRKVDISGEAFFEVHKAEKPFIVDLGKLHIKVLGTSFNVITDENSDQIIITLIEGRIALYESDKPGAKEKILTPNSQAVYSKSNGDINISSIRPETITSWVTGVFRFEGNTLGEITEELERAFHAKIHIENELMKKKTFNAVFEEKETLEEILSILQISARYTIEKHRGEIYLN